MIPFFPRPLPDEIFYSLVARYFLLTGFDTTQIVNQQLFGYSKIQPSILFPSRLDKFYETSKLLLDLKREELINTLTPLPFFENFIDDCTCLTIIDMIWRDAPSNISGRMGLNGSKSCSIGAPKFCPQCAVEDFKKYDQIYWHRVHQLPILICPHHNIRLVKFESSLFKQNPYKFQVASGVDELSSTSIFQNQNQLLNRIANLSLELLEGKKKLEDSDFDYKSRLSALGYYKGKSIDLPKFIQGVCSKHKASEIQELIYLQAGGMRLEDYLMQPIHRPSKIFDPTRHLVLQSFLEDSEEQSPHKSSVFGNGPWPCLNKASDHFLELTINQYSTRYETKVKQNVAIFKCSCGMVYRKYFRSGTRKEAIKIIEYGSIWESRLQELLRQNHSFYSMSKILGADIRLVKRKCQVLPVNKTTINKIEAQTNHYRKVWSKLLRETRHPSISHARETAPKIYKWLYRHDKEWLQKENLANLHKERDAQLRIDWGQRDELALKALIENHNILLQTSRRKITKSLLLNSVSEIKNIPWHKITLRLPKSSAFMDSVKESTNDFQLRKISMTIVELSEDKKRLNRSSILVKAGLRKLTHQANHKLQSLWPFENTQ